MAKEFPSHAQDPAIQRTRALRQHSFFQLHVDLKRGKELVPKDACGEYSTKQIIKNR